MKMINPSGSTSATTYSITYIPRFYGTGSTTLDLYDPMTTLTTTLSGLTSSVDGVDVLSFSGYTFFEDKKIKLTIKDSNIGVVFRGEILPTTQPTDTYKLTTNIYEHK